jgi:type I restriction enzyme R subunit
MPYDLLRDKDGLNLREYQLKAIQAAETAIINGQRSVLLAMATGTGKTRTILGMIYRFLKTGRLANAHAKHNARYEKNIAV